MSLEDALLERFFLEPGMLGPIRSVYITDDDILEIFGSSDIDHARASFIATLPRKSLLAAYLSGELQPPIRNGRPDFLRILLFLSWMQVTSLRPKGLRDFRDMLDQQLGHQLQHMQGLNGMWETLEIYLRRDHEVELVLPNKLPHSQIGRTLRIAFPTWRDRGVLRRLRANLERHLQLVPLQLSARIRSSAAFAGAPPSFKYNFEIWEEARLRGDQDAFELPFWRAWMFIVSESGGHDEIEASEDEYGGLSLATVAPDGTANPILKVEASTRLRPGLVEAIRKGRVFMEAMGFGRFRSTAALDSRTLLVADVHMSGVDATAVKNLRPLRGGWQMVTFRGSVEAERLLPQKAISGAGWKGGIRVGSAYLGRVPLTPYYEHAGLTPVVVHMDGKPVDVRVSDRLIELDTGMFDGSLSATAGARKRTVRVLSSALEHPEHRRRVMNDANEASEDGAVFGTLPIGAGVKPADWAGPRHNPSPEFESIGEALYARSIRGMPMSEAIDIIGRGISRRSDAPGPWDILKSFSDGGWLDLAMLRNFPARKVMQPSLRFSRDAAFPEQGSILGPMVSASISRIGSSAIAAGVTMQSLGGISAWSPPYFRIHAQGPDALDEFLRRSGLPLSNSLSVAPALEQWGDQVSLHQYQAEARWQPTTGFFDAAQSDASVDGLYRMASSREADPKIYAIHVNGAPVSTFRSPSLAVLAYSRGKGIPGAFVENDRLLRTEARVSLPASWARWVAAISQCNAGPVYHDGRWGYAYASSTVVTSVLMDILSLPGRKEVGDRSWDNFLASRSRRGRHLLRRNGQVSLARGRPLSQGNAE